MITIIPMVLILALSAYVLRLNRKIEKEKRRNRMVQAFLAGVIRVISDYRSRTDRIHLDKLPAQATSFPIPYNTVLENIDWEFGKDFLLEHFEKWLKEDRLLFFEEPKFSGDGFNFMYLDFFDRRLATWQSRR